MCYDTSNELVFRDDFPYSRIWQSVEYNCCRQSYNKNLHYRKQIARQLRTQYVESISVTLKSRLRVTQGHWKRNQWVDHTRLTISGVICR